MAAASVPGGALLTAIKSFIEKRLPDLALDMSMVPLITTYPAVLADFFESAGRIVAGWIRNPRLASRRRVLVNPRSREISSRRDAYAFA